MGEPLDCKFTVGLDCHYLLRVPELVDEGTPLVVTLHGFAGTPEAMLKLTERLMDTPAVIAAVQGPNQFFLPPAIGEVRYGWITNRRPAESIRLHHEMVSRVLAEVGGQFGISSRRRLLLGFSQSVALNYRFAAACPDAIRGLIGICGGMPGDWCDSPGPKIEPSVLHIATRQDEYYPASTTDGYAERLRRHAADVEFHSVDGGHRIPGSAREIVAAWMRRTLG